MPATSSAATASAPGSSTSACRPASTRSARTTCSGFVTGPFTGTPAICSGRFTVVGKSPLTGGWGDANCGGVFGPVPALRRLRRRLLQRHRRDADLRAHRRRRGDVPRRLAALGQGLPGHRGRPLGGARQRRRGRLHRPRRRGRVPALVHHHRQGPRRGALRPRRRHGLQEAQGGRRARAARRCRSPTRRWPRTCARSGPRQLMGEGVEFKVHGTTSRTIPNTVIGDTPIKNWVGTYPERLLRPQPRQDRRERVLRRARQAVRLLALPHPLRRPPEGQARQGAGSVTCRSTRPSP